MGLTDSELVKDVAKLIEEWLEWRNGASLKLLANATGLHYNTIRSYAQGEAETAPSLETCMALLRIMLPKDRFGDRAQKWMLKHWPDMREFMFMNSQDSNGVEPLTEIALLETFTKPDFILISLAGTHEGTSKEKAIDRLGRETAMDSISKLLNAGVLKKYGDRYIVCKERFQILGSVRVLQQIAWLAEIFDHKLLDFRGSLYRLITAGLSWEAIEKIHKVVFDSTTVVEGIVNDPANRGPHIMGYGIISTFIDTPLKEQAP